MSQGFELFAKLGGDASGLKRAMGEAQSASNRTQGALGKLASVGAVSLKALAGAATVASGALAAMTVKGLANVDAQAKMARSVDGTVDGLRALQIAAQDAGISKGALSTSAQMLNQRLAEAARGSGTAVQALDALGLSAQDLMRMDVDERMATLADRMQQMGMSAGQSSDMMRQLGVRSREMSLLMIQGGDAIRNARQEVKDLGLSIDQVDAAKVEIANDAFARIGMVISSISDKIAIEFAPILLAVAEHFQSIAKEAGGMGSIVDNVFAGMQRGVGYVLDFVNLLRIGWLTMSRTFQQAAALQVRVFADLAETLTNLYNKIPFFDERQFGADIRGFQLSLESMIEETSQKIDGLMNQDRPSVRFGQSIDRMKNRISELAKASTEASRRVGDSLQEVVANPYEKIVPKVKEHVGEIEQFGIQAARNIQDSFARFLFDPFKDGLKGMLSGFVNMLRDMVSQLLARQLLLGFFGQFAGGGGLLGGIAGGLIGRQKGGPANRNTPYMVGERGPELMVPNASGTVIPNHRLGSGGGTNVSVTINAEDPGAEGRIRTMVEQDIAPKIVQSAVGQTLGRMSRPSFA